MDDNKVVVVGPRRIIARSFVEFFSDLAQGDPVAWGLCFVLVVFLAIIAALGAWFLYQRKKSRDAFKKKVAEKRKKEDQQFKSSKKTKEI